MYSSHIVKFSTQFAFCESVLINEYRNEYRKGYKMYFKTHHHPRLLRERYREGEKLPSAEI